MNDTAAQSASFSAETGLRRYGSDLQIGGRRLFVRGARGPASENPDFDQDRPGLLLIHGFPTSSHDWLGIWSRLAAQYSLLAPDLLGLGLSEKPFPHQYSVTEQAQLIDVLVALSGRRRWHILAHDLGDSVAQELLARQLENRLSFEIVSICFLNGGLFPEAHRPLLLQRLLASALGPALVPFLNRRSFSSSMRRICRNPWPVGELDAAWQLLAREQGTRVIPPLLGYIEERRKHRERWLRAMGEGGVPMRLINGLADPISGRPMAERYLQLVANADVHGLDGVGHYPQIESPEAVVHAALEFFARERPSPAG